MRGYVTRTFLESTIHAEVVTIVDGKINTSQLPSVTVEGKVSPEKAIKVVKKAHKISGNVIVTVTDINETSVLLGVPVEKFKEIAEELTEEVAVDSEVI